MNEYQLCVYVFDPLNRIPGTLSFSQLYFLSINSRRILIETAYRWSYIRSLWTKEKGIKSDIRDDLLIPYSMPGRTICQEFIHHIYRLSDWLEREGSIIQTSKTLTWILNELFGFSPSLLFAPFSYLSISLLSDPRGWMEKKIRKAAAAASVNASDSVAGCNKFFRFTEWNLFHLRLGCVKQGREWDWKPPKREKEKIDSILAVFSSGAWRKGAEQSLSFR